jgi:hypothetical protein
VKAIVPPSPAINNDAPPPVAAPTVRELRGHVYIMTDNITINGQETKERYKIGWSSNPDDRLSQLRIVLANFGLAMLIFN